MSHELRQPLYASKTAALNIARDPVVNSMPSLKRNVDLIIREMAKGDQQINNVLDFSKNRRDPRAPVIGSFDLFRKVECAVSSASGQAYARELYIDFIVDGEVPNQVESCDNSWGTSSTTTSATPSSTPMKGCPGHSWPVRTDQQRHHLDSLCRRGYWHWCPRGKAGIHL